MEGGGSGKLDLDEYGSGQSTGGKSPASGVRGGHVTRLSSLDVVLDQLLGKGSYGMVYSARTTQFGAVAVKVLPWSPAEVSSDLKKELRLLQKCDSEYIVRAHGMFLKPRELWIVMELCDLGSLLDVMRLLNKPLDEDAIAAACHDALKGLVYLHGQKRGIIHRDIKCANLLLSSSGMIKLADFGVAAQLNSTASKRSSVIGTPHWMAPEVIQNGKYDARADVWSLGITAIEMAQMRPPLADVRPVLKVMFAIASADPPTVAHPELFTPGFSEFIAFSLKKEAVNRPSSQEMLQHAFLSQASTSENGPARESLRRLIESAVYAKAHPPPKEEQPQETVEEGTLLPEPSQGGDTTDGGTFCVKESYGAEAEDSGGGTFCVNKTLANTVCMHDTAPASTPGLAADKTLRAGAGGGNRGGPPAGSGRGAGASGEASEASASDDFHTAQAGALDDIDVAALQRASKGEKAAASVVLRSHSDDALFEKTLSRFASAPLLDSPRGGQRLVRPPQLSPVLGSPNAASSSASKPQPKPPPPPPPQQRSRGHGHGQAPAAVEVTGMPERRRSLGARVTRRASERFNERLGNGDVEHGGANCVLS